MGDVGVNAGRSDYSNRLKGFRQIRPGEPMFLILGHDLVSGPAVRHWAVLAQEAGSPPAVIEQALQQGDAMDRFGEKKVPDADHLSLAEARHLEYQLGRRAWNARNMAEGPIAALLAHRRGYQLAAARGVRAEQLLAALTEAAGQALRMYPAGEATSKLALAVAEAGAHVAASQADREFTAAPHQPDAPQREEA